jgi:DNA-binding response OmpR family regulator
MVRPSCPALVIHDDDAFRKSLIATLDQEHFTVTISADGDAAVDILRKRKFRVVLIGVNLKTSSGVRALDYLKKSRNEVGCGVIIMGDPDPNIRTYAPWANETLLKPVDAAYVATRARSYCDCTN